MENPALGCQYSYRFHLPNVYLDAKKKVVCVGIGRPVVFLNCNALTLFHPGYSILGVKVPENGTGQQKVVW